LVAFSVGAGVAMQARSAGSSSSVNPRRCWSPTTTTPTYPGARTREQRVWSSWQSGIACVQVSIGEWIAQVALVTAPRDAMERQSRSAFGFRDHLGKLAAVRCDGDVGKGWIGGERALELGGAAGRPFVGCRCRSVRVSDAGADDEGMGRTQQHERSMTGAGWTRP
jgi:hypothetical protein